MVGVLGCRFGGGGWVMGLPVLCWWKWVVCWWKLSSLSPHLRAFSPKSKLSNHHRGSLTWMLSAVANLAVGCCGGVVVWVWGCSASDGEMGLGFGFWVSPTAKW
ncbi:hypothetical protein FCV25MIE_14890, partial [Fagus crenata]